MKKIRVAMLAPPWLPIPPLGYGGIENVIAALVPSLQKMGVDVELFSVGDSTLKVSKNHWLYKEGQFEHIHRPMFDSSPISIAQVLFAINHIRKDGHFDIIHDHNGFFGSLALSLDVDGLPPTIQTLHGPPFTYEDRLKQGIPDNLPMWKQFTETSSLYFVPISHALGNDAPQAMKKRLLPVVYNALDVNDFPLVEKKEDYFITLGRFHPEKGQHIAAKLCLELGYKLKMAGRVGDLTTSKKILLELANPLSVYRSLVDFRYYSDKIFPYLLNGSIENVGEVKGQAKLELISKAKALLFPIQWDEPFGMVAIEALACGTPVVAMARGAMPEIIKHGVNGFLAQNEREFKKYMKKVDEIDPLVCRQTVEKKFSAEKMAKGYLDRYKKVIELQKSKTR